MIWNFVVFQVLFTSRTSPFRPTFELPKVDRNLVRYLLIGTVVGLHSNGYHKATNRLVQFDTISTIKEKSAVKIELKKKHAKFD